MASSARSKSADPLALVRRELAHALAGSGCSEVCVALSGGCDSVLLLHATAALARAGARPLQVRAVHVHHGLSPNADRWAAFCRRLCRSEGIALRVVRVAVDRAAGLGIEAAARAQRQRVFAAQPVDAVLLGHHRDDQAETVLLQLLRGAGLRGLAAMPVASRQAAAGGALQAAATTAAGRGNASAGATPLTAPGVPTPPTMQTATREADAAGPVLLRPLLALPRATLAAAARQAGLAWIDDESNADTAFDRNFIRHQVLPLLEQRWPAARASLARSARLLGEAGALLEAQAQADLAAAMDAADGSVSIDRLRALGPARAREALRAWLRAKAVEMPPERRLAEALRQAMTAAGHREMAVPFDHRVLRRYRDRLYLPVAEPMVESAARWASESETGPDGAHGALGERLRWNRRAQMRLAALGGRLEVHAASGEGIGWQWLRSGVLEIGCRGADGESAPRLAIGDPPRRRTLKNLWQESAVPPWLRSRWPLLWLDGELACVPGVAVAGRVRAAPGEPGRVFRWVPDCP